MMKGTIYLLSFICFGTTYGFSRFKREIPNGYGVKHPCPGKGHWDAVGHMSGGYTPQKNVFGEAFRNESTKWTVKLCNMDSDGDGLTNGEELGDPQCKWRPRGNAPGPVRGHPGFCEPDRPKCDSGMSHRECPNLNSRGRSVSRTPPRRPPPGANDHPQTSLKKNMDQGGMGRGVPGLGMERNQFPQTTGFGNPPRSFGVNSVRFDSRFGGDSRGPSFGFGGPGNPSFQPPTRPGSTYFSSGFGGESFGATGLSRDFGITGPSRGVANIALQAPRLDSFSSSLDQRAIQGMGSPSSWPSFRGSLSQSDIDRSVRARMDRERSRLSVNSVSPGGMRSGGVGQMDSRSMGSFYANMRPMGSGGMRTMGGSGMSLTRSGGISSMGGGGMGPVSGGGPFGGSGFSLMSDGSMVQMDVAGMGQRSSGGMSQMSDGMGQSSGSMGTDSMRPMGSGFPGGMESYPPFRTMQGTSMSGPAFTGGMSMAWQQGSGGMTSRRPFSRF